MDNNQVDFTVSETPEHIDITFGNVCNLKCIMCSSFSSSKIETEYQQHKQKYNLIGIIQPAMPKLNKWWEDPKILEQVLHVISKAKYINFSGGEPLLTPQIIDMLKATPKNCQVEINTNLTKLTDEHINCLRKFDLARISISLDGVGSHHEYIRYDSNWREIENNINKLFDANIKNLEIAFSYILQHTSIYTFPSFWNYMKNFSNRIRISEVVPNTHKDNLMTINSAHPTDVSKFQQWAALNPNKYSNIIETWVSNYNFDPQSHREFKQYMSTIDQIRGCDFKKTFNPSW
jgi:sulfatase maturation enzyme AslB (radical SAM superfamily)